MRKQPRLAVSTVALLAFTFSFLICAQFASNSAAATTATQANDATPFAVIKTILVSGATRQEANELQVTVIRQQRSVPVTSGMMLFVGDEVTTMSDVKLTILFLNDPAVNDNEVSLDENSRVQLGSVFSWIGRQLYRVKGAFATRTTRATWGVTGTEFELVVEADGTNTLRVLKGSVNGQTGTFSPVTARLELPRLQKNSFAFSNATWTEPQGGSFQREMEFVAVSGKDIDVRREFFFTNTCNEKHRYQIQGPGNLPWFQVLGGDQFDIEGRQTRAITFAIGLDARRVRPSVRQGEIIARCLDCVQESGCGRGDLKLAIVVRIINPENATPTPDPSPVTDPSATSAPQTQTANAAKLETIRLAPGAGLVKTPSSLGEIDQTLNWSHQIIVSGQPTYSAQSVVPHFRTWGQRQDAFRVARRSSVVRGDAESFQRLAEIYVDWGNGAKAEEELRLSGKTADTPGELLTLGEAYRMMGRLGPARQQLESAIRIDPNFAAAHNALGNVSMDQARLAREMNDLGRFRYYLSEARKSYERALALQTARLPDDAGSKKQIALRSHPQGRRARAVSTSALELEKIVAQTNLGEVDLAIADMLRNQGASSEATISYQSAEQNFHQAESAGSPYVFATKGLGDVYRGLSSIAIAKNDPVRARSEFDRAQQKYFQAINQTRDLGEAHVGLGRLYKNHGQEDDAIKAFANATRYRPDQPEGYYHLAVTLYRRKPELAAAYARVYLRMQPAIFREGNRAEDAKRVSRKEPPRRDVDAMVPRSTPDPSPESTSTSTATPTPGPTSTRTVKIPGLKGDDADKALAELRRLGFNAQATDVPDCEASNEVLYSQPAKDERVPFGSTVTIFVSRLDPNARPVPRVEKLPRAEAEGLLRDFRIKVERYRTNPTVTVFVLKQKPDDGRRLMKGCEVEITLGANVPDLKGQSVADATRELSSAGLNRGSIDYLMSDQPPGTVVDQSPRPGGLAKLGSSVTLYVSVEMTTVPDLTKRNLAQVRAMLAAARLRIGSVTYEANYDWPVNTVIRQNPGARQNVAVGTAVSVVLASHPDIIGSVRPTERVGVLQRISASLDGSEDEDNLLLKVRRRIIMPAHRAEGRFKRRVAFN